VNFAVPPGCVPLLALTLYVFVVQHEAAKNAQPASNANVCPFIFLMI
jgi:hypothetical protein